LHGWVYDLRTGYLKELALIRPNTKIDDIYQFEWDEEQSSETPASSPAGSLSLKSP
jgi:hypothetical protein